MLLFLFGKQRNQSMKQNMQTLYKLLKDVKKSDDGVFDEIPSTCSMYQLGNTGYNKEESRNLHLSIM